MNIKSTGISKSKEKAQAMVELALTLPLLLILMLGIIEFGRLMFVYSAIITATREAARYGSAAGGFSTTDNYYQDCDGIRSAAKRIGGIVGLTDGDIAISYDGGPGTSYPDNCPAGGTGPQLVLGDRIIITMTFPFKPIVPLVNVPEFDIVSRSTRTIVKDVEIR
jgi:hypothetical protein